MNRFWSKVDKTPGLGPNGDCWEWKAGEIRGYGYFWYKGKTIKAHRFSWFLERGKWPELFICHTCDNPGCVNPYHLFEGTCANNHKDRNDKGRQAKGEINGRAILTESLVTNDVIPSLKKGESGASIGRRLGVSAAQISLIKNRKNWSHVK